MKLMIRLVVFALACGVLFAQADANKGQIAGTVFDQRQSVIPNAKINVKNTATGFSRDVTSGAEGQFRAVLLDPGTYDVTVNAPGFAPAEYKGLTLNVGSVVNLPVTLQVGTTTQTVEVTAELTGVD